MDRYLMWTVCNHDRTDQLAGWTAVILSDTYDDALTQAWEACYRRFPTGDGWINHSTFIEEFAYLMKQEPIKPEDVQPFSDGDA